MIAILINIQKYKNYQDQSKDREVNWINKQQTNTLAPLLATGSNFYLLYWYSEKLKNFLSIIFVN